MKKAFVVTGLGYGDEGKGTVTAWLAHQHHVHTVIRTGGAQARHMVVRPSGESHGFSQFGSGTLRGSATHLSKHMVTDPHAILREGEVLTYEHGVRGVFDMMTIHEEALVITPFQAIAGRLRELLRADGRHGSVGIGIGETILDAEVLGTAAIRAKDLLRPGLREKLEVIREHKLVEFAKLISLGKLSADTQKLVRREMVELEEMDTVEWAIERFAELVRRVKIVDTDYLTKKILDVQGTVIVEGSQGVLLDRYQGFHPHTTKVRTVPSVAKNLLDESGYDGRVVSLGVLRAYHTRHGAGPFVSESDVLTALLPDSANKKHLWQGDFRVGSFDLVAAKYAIEATGRSIDGLVITCLDRIEKLGYWPVCGAYNAPPAMTGLDQFFQSGDSIIKGILASEGQADADQLVRQEQIGQFLKQCTPRPVKFSFSNPSDLIKVCREVIEKATGVQVVAVSFGPTELEKLQIKTGDEL